MANTAPSSFPLLKLPSELQNRIYRFALIEDGDIVIEDLSRY